MPLLSLLFLLRLLLSLLFLPLLRLLFLLSFLLLLLLLWLLLALLLRLLRAHKSRGREQKTRGTDRHGTVRQIDHSVFHFEHLMLIRGKKKTFFQSLSLGTLRGFIACFAQGSLCISYRHVLVGLILRILFDLLGGLRGLPDNLVALKLSFVRRHEGLFTAQTQDTTDGYNEASTARVLIDDNVVH